MADEANIYGQEVTVAQPKLLANNVLEQGKNFNQIRTRYIIHFSSSSSTNKH